MTRRIPIFAKAKRFKRSNLSNLNTFSRLTRINPLFRLIALAAGLIFIQTGIYWQQSRRSSSKSSNIHHQWSQERLDALTSAIKSLPDGFIFTPPLSPDHPPKSRAIITLLTGSAPTSPPPPNHLDDTCQGTLLHAYTFIHSPLTRLNTTSNDTEFIVMHTPEQPQPCLNSLLALGARLLQVPVINTADGIFSHRYHYTYTKYQMWALEGIYDRILYLDADLVYLTRSPVELFHEVDVFHHDIASLNATFGKPEESLPEKLYFYGGCLDWQMPVINGGLLLLEPNLKDYNGLIELIPSTTGFGDQKTLDEYYKSKKTSLLPVKLPRRFNTQWVHHRSEDELRDAVGFHHKFFGDKVGESEEATKVFERFSRRFLELRRIQMEVLGDESRKEGFPVVPIVSNTLDRTSEVRNWRTRFDRVAVLTVGRGSGEEAKRSRMDFARYYSQAVVIDTELYAEVFGAIEYMVSSNVLDKYEWVWAIDPNLVLRSGKDWPIQESLNRWADGDTGLVVFKDCGGTATGSFIVGGKAAREAMAQVHVDAKKELEPPSNAGIWKLLLQKMKSNAKVSDSQMDVLYSYDEGACKGFLTL
ncbi:UNVERIFIED_CONTAM: hypothetical protein HDU68_003938 [Siphonaria sp. JEL0065]|nr:hypothetical protein HDU68_003938 [Siphonaria sp. JEL0065]